VVCSHPSVTGGTFGAGPLSPATPAVSDVSPVRFGRRAGGAWRKFHDTIPTMYGSGRAFSGSLLLLPVNGWADQANCFDVGGVTFDRAHLLAVAACPVDAEHVAAEKRRAVRAVQRGLPQVELCGWLTPLGSAHRPGADE